MEKLVSLCHAYESEEPGNGNARKLRRNATTAKSTKAQE